MFDQHGKDRTLRIACPNFSAEEIGALRRLLGLLEQYLTRNWIVVDEHPGNVYFVNVDLAGGAEVIDLPAGSRVVYCALRPRLHGKDAIHRPLRASEVLAILTEESVSSDRQATGQVVQGDVEWRFQLRAWPVDLEKWPLIWWKIFASISDTARSVGEIVGCVGTEEEEVNRCIAALVGAELIIKSAKRDTRNVPRNDISRARWKGLATRVGQLLGFK
jgi:hypothetical protein